MTGRMQRSGLPLFLLAAFVLAGAVGIVLLVFSPLSDGFFSVSLEVAEDGGDATGPQLREAVEPEEREPDRSPDPTDGGSTTAEPADLGADSPAFHTIDHGDTLFDIAGRYFLDPYLWPVLFVANANSIIDPDILLPGSRLVVPPLPVETAAIVDAHLRAYQRYRRIGDEALGNGQARGSQWLIQLGLSKINKARWVLYSGLRYDENLVETVQSAIRTADREILQGFIQRFGPRPGSR